MSVCKNVIEYFKNVTDVSLFILANDVILSHMITFLNDKEDTQLRKSFFDCIVSVCSYIGWHCSNILTPLLLQGLTDSSEFVTRKAIIAMGSLTEYNLVNTFSLCELINETSHFLVHPNLWIREAVCGFIAKAGERLSLLDIQCKVMPHLERYMKYKLIQIEKPELLLDSLVSPIPRSVYDAVINYSDIGLLLEVLEKRKQVRDSINLGNAPSYDYYGDMNNNLKSLFRRLEAIGMTEQTEEFLLGMSQHLKKIHKHKSSVDARFKHSDGKADVDNISSFVRNKVFQFSDTSKSEYIRSGLHRTNTLGSTDISDWNCSSDVLTRQSESTNSGAPSIRSNNNSRPSSPPPDAHISQVTDASSMHVKSFIQYGRSLCYKDLTKLKNIQQDHYTEALRHKEWAEQAAWKPQLPPPGWHPRGILVAHLHEHKGAVNRLCRFTDSCVFASSSDDGTVRLWDCSSFESGAFANRSKLQFKLPHSSPVTGLAVCEGGESLAASCQSGSIQILNVNAPTKTPLSRLLDPSDEGFAVDVQCLDPGNQKIIVYATLYGDLVAWDLRQRGIAWRLENGLRQGVITTFCVDAQQNWLALGTCDGIHTVWDLRFRLPITTIPLSSTGGQAVRIRKVIPHPTEHSWLMSSVQGNNEISMWNLETGSRQKVLWGSITPPLSKSSHSTQESSHSVCAMLAGCIDRSPFLLSGGTDQRIRFWNLESPPESYLAIPAASDTPGTTLSYRSRLIDGTDVVYEEHSNKRPEEEAEKAPRAGPEPPAVGHRDCISDITLCKASQCFMITASRDGVIKVSK